MILIITSEADHHTDFFVKKLDEVAVPYFRFNADKFGTEHNVSFSIMSGHKLVSLKEPTPREVSFNDINGIWYRKPFVGRFDRIHKKPEIAFAVRESDSYINDLVFSLDDKRWVNHPLKNRRGDNKLWQLRLAESMGMKIPQTCVTNDPCVLRQFFNEMFPRKIVYKTLSNPNISEGEKTYRSVYTTVIPELTEEVLTSTELAPCLFQEMVEKDHELRITVVGSKVFGVRIYSQEHKETSIDWRKDPEKVIIRQEPFEPTGELRRKCVEITRKMGLKFATIDMIQTPCEDLVFLEVNPNGNWLWKELSYGLEVSKALIEELCG